MKKLLLTLGAIASVAAPVAAVVACTTEKNGGSGFKNASLIENFDINDENQVEETDVKIEFDGKTYIKVQSFLDDWKESIDQWIPTDSTLQSASMNDWTLDVSYDEAKGEVHLQLLDKDGSIPTNKGTTGSGKLKDINETAARILGVPGFNGVAVGAPKPTTWWLKEHPVKVDSDTKITPPKDSIDSIIYTQAQALPKSKVFDTDKDEVLIGKFNEGGDKDDAFKTQDNLNLRPYTSGNSGFYDLTSEFRPGDSLIFAFDDEKDLASFTQRVKYDDTSDARNSMALNQVNVQNINYQDITVKGGELIAKPTNDALLVGDISIFNLKVIDRNAVELTFNKMFDSNNHHIEAQLLYLFGFTDANKDGKTDSKDINMAGPFAIDDGTLYSRYLNNQDGSTYIHKETTIAGYKEVKDFLAKS